jgi:hypothetical protein
MNDHRPRSPIRRVFLVLGMIMLVGGVAGAGLTYRSMRYERAMAPARGAAADSGAAGEAAALGSTTQMLAFAIVMIAGFVVIVVSGRTSGARDRDGSGERNRNGGLA